jgi:hypothetical protein
MVRPELQTSWMELFSSQLEASVPNNEGEGNAWSCSTVNVLRARPADNARSRSQPGQSIHRPPASYPGIGPVPETIGAGLASLDGRLHSRPCQASQRKHRTLPRGAKTIHSVNSTACSGHVDLPLAPLYPKIRDWNAPFYTFKIIMSCHHHAITVMVHASIPLNASNSRNFSVAQAR